MAYAAKLVNPTPWPAKIGWDRGVVLRIPEFGETTLTMQQMDDFRNDKPGSEGVRDTLNHYGLFLMDTDRDYDRQAVEALRRCLKAKKEQYEGVIRRMQDTHSAQGLSLDENIISEKLVMMGYGEWGTHIKQLETQIKEYEAEMTGEDHKPRQQFDPARTIFVTDPPREFPSAGAMRFFLSLPENRDIKVKHESHVARAAEALKAEKVTEPVNV
jgi:hypothetical protein